jgi:anti-anti-sigma factor
MEEYVSIQSKNKTKKTIKSGKNLTAPMVKELKEQILSLIDKGVKELTIDFKDIVSIDFVGLGLIIATCNSIKSVGGNFKIKNVPEDFNRFLQTMRLEKFFQISLPG